MREVVGIVMLVPRGLVALVVPAFDVEGGGRLAAMHLPPWARVPAALGFAVVGAALAWWGTRGEVPPVGRRAARATIVRC